MYIWFSTHRIETYAYTIILKPLMSSMSACSVFDAVDTFVEYWVSLGCLAITVTLGAIWAEVSWQQQCNTKETSCTSWNYNRLENSRVVVFRGNVYPALVYTAALLWRNNRVPDRFLVRLTLPSKRCAKRTWFLCISAVTFFTITRHQTILGDNFHFDKLS